VWVDESEGEGKWKRGTALILFSPTLTRWADKKGSPYYREHLKIGLLKAYRDYLYL
jgi:hypothetical protein